jgi:hypothetical protein
MQLARLTVKDKENEDELDEQAADTDESVDPPPNIKKHCAAKYEQFDACVTVVHRRDQHKMKVKYKMETNVTQNLKCFF